MKNTNQEGLKYQKLYNWAHTLITSGVIRNMDKFPSEPSLQKKFGYSRQTVRTALQQLEEEGLITRVRGSGTYVSYEGQMIDDDRPRVGLLLSYYSEYLFPEVYDGIEASLSEKGYRIDVAVTKNRLNDEAVYLESMLKNNVSGLIIEGSRSAFPNPNLRLNDEAVYLESMLKNNVSGLIIEGSRSAFPNPNLRLFEEIKKRNIPTIFIHNHYENMSFDSVEMSDTRSAYELTKTLIEHGHRKIGGILKYDDMQGIARYKGLIQCMSDYGIKYDDDCIRWYSTREMEDKFGKKGLTHIYRHTRECTAMMIYNDEVARVYLEFLDERGIHVPEDLSVVSFDDAELMDNTDVKVLSAIHPKNKLGYITGNHLLRMMDDEDWQTKNYAYRFPVRINDGNSVRKL